MADELEHLSINVEAAIAHRLHGEAQFAREQARAADKAWRDRLGELVGVEDPNEQARIRRHAQVLRSHAASVELRVEQTERSVRAAIRRAESIPDDADPAALQPITRTKVTKAELEQAAKERVEVEWENLRAARDALLAASDWRVMPDAPTRDPKVWERYRAKLRDLPAAVNDPFTVRWPAPPND